MSGDLERYVHIARSLMEGRFSDYIHFHYPPLFPTLFAPLSAVLGDYEAACRVVAIIFGSLVVVPLYLLALKTHSRGAAVVAASLYALIFFIGSREQEQVLLFFLFCSILLGLLSLEKKRAGYFITAGVCFGLSFLVKPEGWGFFLAFLVIATGYWLFTSFRYGDPEAGAKGAKELFPGKRGLICIALMLLAYFIITGPYLFAYYQRSGKISLNPKARSLMYIHNLRNYSLLYKIQKGPSEYFTMAQRVYQEGDDKPVSESIPYLLYKFRKRFVTVWWQRFKLSLFNNIIPKYLERIVPLLWPLLLIAGLYNRREKLAKDLYLHMFALVPLLLVPFFTSIFPRFYFSLLPWFMIFMGRGLWRMTALLSWLFAKAGAEKRRMQAFILVVLVVVGLYFSGWRTALSRPHPFVKADIEFRKEIAAELKSMLPEGCRFMAELTKRSMWYLAGFHPTRQEVLPSDRLDRILVFALRKDVKLIVHHEHSRSHYRFATVDPLLRKDFSSPRLKLRLRRTSPTGKVYVIYEVVAAKCEQE